MDGVSFDLHAGQTLGVVGESGCGKSTLARALLNLHPATAGSIVWNGKQMVGASKADWMAVRKDIQMVFQDPLASLNPRMTAGQIIGEPLRIHRPEVSASDRANKVRALMDRVGLTAQQVNRYPHEFSGGMRQRVMIAMALACRPRLLIADEPTTALDVTIQAQIIDLINELVQEANTAVIIITHDMGVIASMADDVAVMYAGRIVEYGSLHQVFRKSQHPYTQALMGAIPRLRSFGERLTIINGGPPSPTERIVGCSFYPRCNARQPHCAMDTPPLADIATGHTCACLLAVPTQD